MRPSHFFAALLLCGTPLVAQIDSIEINQAIGVQKNNALKFVAGKGTVVRAFLASPAAIDKDQTSATVTCDGNVVATANAPVMSNVAPEASGTVNGPITVTWSATDADNDKLSYEIVYNPDTTNPQSEWEVLARDVNERRYRIDSSAPWPAAHTRASASSPRTASTPPKRKARSSPFRRSVRKSSSNRCRTTALSSPDMK